MVSITNKNGIYKSAVICGKYSLTYKLGKRTKSILDSGILLFDTRENARIFKGKIGCGREIFKVKVFGNEINNPVYFSPCWLDDGVCRPSSFGFPKGTKSFPEIELIKKQ